MKPVLEVARPGAGRAPQRVDLSVVIPDDGDPTSMDKVLDFIPGWVSEVVIVTADGTRTPTIHLPPGGPMVRTLVKPGCSLGGSLRLGFDSATSDMIVAVLPGEATDPRELLSYAEELFAGADVVHSTRLGDHRQPGRATRFRVYPPFFAAHKSAVGRIFDDRCEAVGARELGVFLRVQSIRLGITVSEVHESAYRSLIRHGLTRSRRLLVANGSRPHEPSRGSVRADPRRQRLGL